MEALLIKPTDYTPSIVFDPKVNKYEISGESRPENVRSFYEPVIGWMDDYARGIESGSQNPREITFEFKIKYFNSTSAKYIATLFTKLSEINKKGTPVKVNWYYNIIDIEMKETGEEFEKMLSMPFNYVTFN